jgi:hypothetical protein
MYHIDGKASAVTISFLNDYDEAQQLTVADLPHIYGQLTKLRNCLISA